MPQVVVGSRLDEIFMVMEYVEHDLKQLSESMKQPFSVAEVFSLRMSSGSLGICSWSQHISWQEDDVSLRCCEEMPEPRWR